MKQPTLRQIWLPAVLLVGGILVFWVMPVVMGAPKLDLKIVPAADGAAKKP